MAFLGASGGLERSTGENKAWIQSHSQGHKMMEVFQSPGSPNHGTLGSKNHGVAAKKRTLAHPVGFPHFTDVGRELAISGQASFLKDELLPVEDTPCEVTGDPSALDPQAPWPVPRANLPTYAGEEGRPQPQQEASRPESVGLHPGSGGLRICILGPRRASWSHPQQFLGYINKDSG